MFLINDLFRKNLSKSFKFVKYVNVSQRTSVTIHAETRISYHNTDSIKKECGRNTKCISAVIKKLVMFQQRYTKDL